MRVKPKQRNGGNRHYLRFRTEDLYGTAAQPSGLCGATSLGAGIQLGAQAGQEIHATMREKQFAYANTPGAKPVEFLHRILADNQPSVEIHVLQGERSMARDNKTIGRFHLDGITPAPRGIPQIEVTFDIDANGILNVSAKDKATGKEQKIRIEASSGLSEDEIKRMRDEAKANEAADKAEREKIDKINGADALIFQSEKNLKEYGDKIPADKKGAIENALGQLREAHKSQNISDIDRATEALNNAWHAASEDMARAAQAGPSAGAGSQAGSQTSGGASSNSGSGSGDDNVKDVDYEEVK